MGDRQLIGQGADAQEGFAVASATAENHGLTGQQLKQPQSGGIGQGFEDIAESFNVFHDISNC